MAQSKPFAIATEGPTIDGRAITREWIEQMAKTYDPKVYTAVANLEHLLSQYPDGLFKAYGKVISLATREADILGEKKLQLMAIVDASDDIIALQKKGQKSFASMEVISNFVGKGLAYLSGLAFTDKPASLGTETMKFSAAGSEGERFASNDEIAIEFEEEDKPSAGASLFAKVKELLGLGKKETDAHFADQAKAIEVIAQSQKEIIDRFASIDKFDTKELDAKTADSIKTLQEAQAKIAADFAALQTKLGTTDGDQEHRSHATGGNGTIKTDC